MAYIVDGNDRKDILVQGRALYRGKDYKAALQCFNTGCPQSISTIVIVNMTPGCFPRG